MLILDAFSGDAIPIHLLTREAFALYDQHLKENGIIAIHNTTLYDDLKPVTLVAGNQLGMMHLSIEDKGKRWYEYENDWILLTRNNRFARSELLLASQSNLTNPSTTLWTGDFSNLFEVIDRDI